MATLQVDYAFALNRSGFLNAAGREALFEEQRTFSFADIADHCQVTRLGVYGAWEECLRLFDVPKDSYEDEFQVIDLSFDLFRDVRVSKNSILTTDHPYYDSKWLFFLVEYGLLTLSTNEKNSICILFDRNMTPEDKFETCTRLISTAPAKNCPRKDTKYYIDHLLLAAVERVNLMKYSIFVPLPLAETERNISALIRLSQKFPEDATIDYALISIVTNVEYIVKNMHLPWHLDSMMIHRTDLTVEIYKHLAANGLVTDWSHALNRSNVTPHQLREIGLPAGFPHKSLLRKDNWCVREGSIWHILYYLSSGYSPDVRRFRKHAAAGVVQRVWRRHRERLRRRSFAFQWLAAPSRLTALPRDLQWLVYRYVRPAHVPRGLPPKFH